jgi:hypothetical protein
MALFVDGNITSLQDLAAQESSILDLAHSEGIDLGAKLELAQRELAIELDRFISRNAGGADGVSVENVVITQPLRRWHALRTLMLAYRDASNNQLNDRFRDKLATYAQVERGAAGQLFEAGVGVVWNPVHATDPEQSGSDQAPDFYVTRDQRLRRG